MFVVLILCCVIVVVRENIASQLICIPPKVFIWNHFFDEGDGRCGDNDLYDVYAIGAALDKSCHIIGYEFNFETVLGTLVLDLQVLVVAVACCYKTQLMIGMSLLDARFAICHDIHILAPRVVTVDTAFP